MDRNRVELLVVHTWTLLLLLGLVQGWRHINEHELREILEGRNPFVSVDSVGHVERVELGNNFDEEDDDEDDEPFDETEGDATEDDLDPSSEHGLQGPIIGARSRSPTSDPDGDSSGFDYKCTDNGFIISLSNEQLREAHVIGPNDLQSVFTAPKACGYHVNLRERTLTVPFSGCYVRKEQNGNRLQLLLYQSLVRTASCETVHLEVSPRSSGGPQYIPSCPYSAPDTPPSGSSGSSGPALNSPQQQMQFPLPQQMQFPLPQQTPTEQPPPMAQYCAVPNIEQVACGQPGISSLECQRMGCCMDPSTSSCFYPVDECTEDLHFVFAIRHDSASTPVDPTNLIIPGTNCKPVLVTDRVAIYKFKLTECGTRVFNVGGTQIYLAEVQTAVDALNLKYGVISRSNPVRFLIECRYSLSAQQSLASAGYMVKTPSSTLPSPVLADGLYGVELKIAKDETYSSFYPTYHQPLRLLLGKPVYLQLHLLSPTPEAVILVNYCIAYPRSASNALVLVHEGCANPNDPHTSVLLNSEYSKDGHERQFVVKAFQFMDQNTNQYLDEEIYFMCSTEVCFPAERTCKESCFDEKPYHRNQLKN